jgi:hypothetical protein
VGGKTAATGAHHARLSDLFRKSHCARHPTRAPPRDKRKPAATMRTSDFLPRSRLPPRPVDAPYE